MGIFELVQSGSNFKRQTITLPSSPSMGETSEFGYTYILLGATAEAPCRVRLYSDSGSVEIDDTRPTSSFALDPAVGLILDTEFDSSTLTLAFDPPIIGTTFSSSGATWYNISSSTTQNVQITAYPIEFSSANSSALRKVLTVSGSGILTGSTGVEGNIYAPTSFIILSGSANTSGSRLRIFSRQISSVPNAEKIRAFGSEPASGSSLIVDIAFDSSSFQYKMVPVLEGYNLTSYADGGNSFGYMLQNISTTASLNITASLLIYTTED